MVLSKKYFFYAKNNLNKEPIGYITASSRYTAAQSLALNKHLSLKSFLSIYSISK
jgi:hypothetical protein